MFRKIKNYKKLFLRQLSTDYGQQTLGISLSHHGVSVSW